MLLKNTPKRLDFDGPHDQVPIPEIQPFLAAVLPQGMESTKKEQGTNEVRGDVLCFLLLY